MRRIWFIAAVLGTSILIGGLMFAPGLVGAHTGGGDMMGPGIMRYGMMGHGHGFPDECAEMMGKYGYRRYPGFPESQKLETGKALAQEDAVSIVQNYLSQTRNPNLTIGEVEGEEDGDYLVEIVTKDGSLVDKLEVNRLSGGIHSIYGE